MIHHVSGSIGSGKSMFCAQVIADSMLKFRPIITNIRLVDGWDYLITKYQTDGLGSFLRYWKSDYVRMIDYQINLATAYSGVYTYHWNIVDACNDAIARGPAIENSRLFIFDEAQLFINSRSWKESSRVITEFFTQSRKLGFEVYLVSQLKDSVDRQVRMLAEYSYTLRNLGNIKPFGLKIFPNFGLLNKRHPDTGTFMGVKKVSYSAWIRNFYRSNDLFGVKQLPPVKWSDGMKGQQWINGCRARYEQGVCDFRKIAVSPDLENFTNHVEPYIRECGKCENEKKEVG